MAPITAADQAFLQLLTQRKVLEESEALEAMDAVGSKLGGFGAFDAGGSGDARADLRATLANLNRKLASADLQIRGYYADHSEEDGDGPPKIHIALINLASDDVAKLTGASQKEEEITCLKSILKALASSEGAELAELRKGARGALGGGLRRLRDDLVNGRWLELGDEGEVAYGPRAILELADVLRGHGAEVPRRCPPTAARGGDCVKWNQPPFVRVRPSSPPWSSSCPSFCRGSSRSGLISENRTHGVIIFAPIDRRRSVGPLTRQYARSIEPRPGTRNFAIWGADHLATSSLQSAGPGRIRRRASMQCNLVEDFPSLLD